MKYDKPLRTLALEQDVEDAITTDMISGCEHIDELLTQLDESYLIIYLIPFSSCNRDVE